MKRGAFGVLVLLYFLVALGFGDDSLDVSLAKQSPRPQFRPHSYTHVPAPHRQQHQWAQFIIHTRDIAASHLVDNPRLPMCLTHTTPIHTHTVILISESFLGLPSKTTMKLLSLLTLVATAPAEVSAAPVMCVCTRRERRGRRLGCRRQQQR